jgi:hypothetical protein
VFTNNHCWVYGLSDYLYSSTPQEGASKQEWGFNQQSMGIIKSSWLIYYEMQLN